MPAQILRSPLVSAIWSPRAADFSIDDDAAASFIDALLFATFSRFYKRPATISRFDAYFAHAAHFRLDRIPFLRVD